VHVDHAAELYAQGVPPHPIGAEPAVHWATVSDQLHGAGITMAACEDSPRRCARILSLVLTSPSGHAVRLTRARHCSTRGKLSPRTLLTSPD
jgi:hypothetical protein